MKKNIIFGSGGFVLGLIVMMSVIYLAAPSMMLFEDVSPNSFEKTVEILEKSTKDKGWKISAVHDLQKSMAKFGQDVKAVKVFELCHPKHAGKILAGNDERIVSSMMPCRIAVYEKDDGHTYVSRMNSGMMASMLGGLVAEVMAGAASENEEILAPVLGK